MGHRDQLEVTLESLLAFLGVPTGRAAELKNAPGSEIYRLANELETAAEVVRERADKIVRAELFAVQEQVEDAREERGRSRRPLPPPPPPPALNS